MTQKMTEKEMRAWAEQIQRDLSKELIRFFGKPAVKLVEPVLRYYVSTGLPEGKIEGYIYSKPLMEEFGIYAPNLKDARIRSDFHIYWYSHPKGHYSAWGILDYCTTPKAARTDRTETFGSWESPGPGLPLVFTSNMTRKRAKPQGRHLVAE